MVVLLPLEKVFLSLVYMRYATGQLKGIVNSDDQMKQKGPEGPH